MHLLPDCVANLSEGCIKHWPDQVMRYMEKENRLLLEDPSHPRKVYAAASSSKMRSFGQKDGAPFDNKGWTQPLTSNSLDIALSQSSTASHEAQHRGLAFEVQGLHPPQASLGPSQNGHGTMLLTSRLCLTLGPWYHVS